MTDLIAVFTVLVSVTITALIIEWAKARREGLRARIKSLSKDRDAILQQAMAQLGEIGHLKASVRGLEATNKSQMRLISDHGPGRCAKFGLFERQSGLNRVRHAAMLIAQLPKDHDGRNTWLMNYGGEFGLGPCSEAPKHVPVVPV